MRIGWLQAPAGVAGDMFVGAVCDCGADLDEIRRAVDSLGLPGVAVTARPVRRAGIAGLKFDVSVGAAAPRRHRHLADVVEIVGRAAIDSAAKTRAIAVFERIACAEAAVHGIDVERVHFHEVGADDTIVDVVAACVGFERLGLDRLYASSIAVGSGTVRCEHGELPVPAPATLELLRGVPVHSGPAGERTTPTGAALVRELVLEFDPELTWVPERIGNGAGSRDDPDFPNLLRLTTGTVRDPGSPGSVLEIACNLDTATGELLGYLLDGALERGALDAWAVPIVMKKGRPAYELVVLADEGRHGALVEFLLEESTTLGVRSVSARRAVLERRSELVATAWGDVRCKVARLPSGAIVRRPEADEIARLSRERGLGRGAVVAWLARELST